MQRFSDSYQLKNPHSGFVTAAAIITGKLLVGSVCEYVDACIIQYSIYTYGQRNASYSILCIDAYISQYSIYTYKQRNVLYSVLCVDAYISQYSI